MLSKYAEDILKHYPSCRKVNINFTWLVSDGLFGDHPQDTDNFLDYFKELPEASSEANLSIRYAWGFLISPLVDSKRVVPERGYGNYFGMAHTLRLSRYKTTCTPEYLKDVLSVSYPNFEVAPLTRLALLHDAFIAINETRNFVCSLRAKKDSLNIVFPLDCRVRFHSSPFAFVNTLLQEFLTSLCLIAQPPARSFIYADQQRKGSPASPCEPVVGIISEGLYSCDSAFNVNAPWGFADKVYGHPSFKSWRLPEDVEENLIWFKKRWDLSAAYLPEIPSSAVPVFSPSFVVEKADYVTDYDSDGTVRRNHRAGMIFKATDLVLNSSFGG